MIASKADYHIYIHLISRNVINDIKRSTNYFLIVFPAYINLTITNSLFYVSCLLYFVFVLMYLKFYKGGRIENNRTAVCGSIYQFAEAMRMQIAFTLYRNHIFYFALLRKI